ncbi:hypothetical protein JANAI62_11350 [Jannaschia pagri]|uniref:Heavy-metal resistance n=1 Tax=Jannaschia pagri TaxID=2829797 RepID=A0ABQ4NK83_9RHOB|nr:MULTISPECIES: periplasmic heavy metal sensor [unclassified Jannaschia]GIT90680.1 hypothetical protein JANAI61_11380 [Jannaschia sp. AI_61]GIT94512.1 hypothetical protein JANAI62_11350 [Jannaschia sp. AI_62]
MKMSRGVKIGLGLSLALNAVVIAAIVGALIVSSPKDRRGGGFGRGGPPEIQAFARALDEPRRDALRTRLRNDPILREGRTRLRLSREAVVTALEADPFDPEELSAAFARLRETQADLTARGSVALATIIGDLTPAERAALADALRDAIGRRGRP